jgi:hypothetical protein
LEEKDLTKTKVKTKQFIFHSLLIKKEDFQDKLVQVVYLPKETAQFFRERIGEEPSFDYKLAIAEFRSIIQSRYKEVLWADFSYDALTGVHPWLYLVESAKPVVGYLIHSRFLNWVSRHYKSKKQEVYIPKLVREEELSVHPIPIAEFFGRAADKKLVSSWFLYHFCKAQKQLSWSVPNTSGEEKELTFPEEWFFNFNGSNFEAVSAPLHITTLKNEENGEQFASYVISLHFEEDNDQLIMHVKSSLRRWNYKPLLQDGKLSFPRRHRRSLYIITKNRTGRHMNRLLINEYNQKVMMSYYKHSIEMFEEMGFTPNLPVILANPKQFYHSSPMVALIPYKQDDKGYPNLVEAGISKAEKTRIFDMFQEVFPFLKLAHEAPRSLSTLPISLRGGTVVLDHPEEVFPEQVNVEIYTKEPSVINLIKEAFTNLTKDIKNGSSRFRFKVIDPMNFSLYDSLTGKEIKVVLIDRSDLVYLTEDLPAASGGKASAERQRMKEIVSALPPANLTTYCLIEIGKYEKNKMSDPKQAIEKGFVETKRLTQCFFSLDDLKTESEKQQKIKICIADILARMGFTNQMFTTYKESFKDYIYYFPKVIPTTVEKKAGFIYVMARMKDAKMAFKYKGTGWMSLEDSLHYLNAGNRKKLFQASKQDYLRFLEDEMKTKEDVLVLQKDEVPNIFQDMEDFDYPFTMAVFDVAAHRNPYIDYQAKGIPSTGAFIVESRGEYFGIPPKFNDKTGKNYNTKQDINAVFRNRQTYRLTLTEQIDSIATNLFLMRNLAITYNYYTNNPLPYHLLHYHEKLLKTE